MQVRRIAKRGDGMVGTGSLAGLSVATREDRSRSARVDRRDGVGRGFPARVAQGGHLRRGEEVPPMRGTDWA